MIELHVPHATLALAGETARAIIMLFGATKFILPFLLYAQAFLTLLFLLNLLRLRLGRRYLFISLFLLADAVPTLFRSPEADAVSGIYSFYGVAEVVSLVLMAFVVRDLAGMILEAHPAIAAFARRIALWVVIALSAIVAVNWGIDPQVSGGGQQYSLNGFYAVERALGSAILGGLLLIVGTISWLPLQVRRNVAAFVTGCVLRGFLDWFVLFTSNLDPTRSGIGPIIAFVAALTWSVCLIWWLVTIRLDGEEASIRTGLSWDEERMKRLSMKLDGINRDLEASFLSN